MDSNYKKYKKFSLNKKVLVLIIILVLLVLVVGYFIWKKYRKPVAPTNKSATSISSNTVTSPKPGVNKTNFSLSIPDNFVISIYASDLGTPRVIAEDPNGVLIVSVPDQGKVVALLDKDKSGTSEQTIDVITGLNAPHGIAFDCNAQNCKLYVAETDKVTVFDYDKNNLTVSNPKKIIDLLSGSGHVTRTIKFLPAPNQDKILISVGSSCNVCVESDPNRAVIIIANKDGSDARIYASGLRNAVFMAINPKTSEIWATDMGRDYLGDNLPPDEINIIKDGLFYGWPYCYGQKIQDNTFDAGSDATQICANSQGPKIEIPAHSAPLGLAFISGSGWPQDYQNNLLVAYHGSWNRSVPTGDKIVRYILNNKGEVTSAQDFITGWLQADGFLGRPVAIYIKQNGIIYISDDTAGVIYKLQYNL